MPAPAATVLDAAAEALGADPGRPFVTMYDDLTGERVELSLATFDNWVCKLANLFTDELELEPGDAVRIAMPTHWQSMAAAVGAWRAALCVCLDPSAEVGASVVGPRRVADSGHDGQVIACSLRPLGLGFDEPLASGWLDWSIAVPAQPDVVVMPRPVAPSDIALRSPVEELSHAQLLERALGGAVRQGLRPGGRLLTDANPAAPDGIETALAAPLATGSSVVLLVQATAARVEAIAAQERVTCQALSEQIAAGPTGPIP